MGDVSSIIYQGLQLKLLGGPISREVWHIVHSILVCNIIDYRFIDLRCAQPLNCLVWSSMLRCRVHRTVWELTTYLQGGHKYIKEFPSIVLHWELFCHACTMWLCRGTSVIEFIHDKQCLQAYKKPKQCRCLTVKNSVCWTTASTWCSLPHWCVWTSVIYHTHT